MRVVHQPGFHRAPLGWNSMNLFSLMFALLLALAFVVLLMLFFEIMQRDRKPMPAPWKPTHATGTLPVAPSRFG